MGNNNAVKLERRNERAPIATSCALECGRARLASEALEQGMAGVGELLEAQLEALGAGSAELSVEDFVDLRAAGRACTR
jgi:hypothetical protein